MLQFQSQALIIHKSTLAELVTLICDFKSLRLHLMQRWQTFPDKSVFLYPSCILSCVESVSQRVPSAAPCPASGGDALPPGTVTRH